MPTLDDLFEHWRNSHGAIPPEELCRDDPQLLPALHIRIAEYIPKNPPHPATDNIPNSPHHDHEHTLDYTPNPSRAPAIAAPAVPFLPSPDDDALPQILGFTLLKTLGHGGQGVVYLALQHTPRRQVAIKILLNAPYASKSAKHRFEREIEFVATLRHPNVVAVFGTGKTTDGHLYYVMDYVRGIPITEYVHIHKLSLEKTLQLVATACDAVNHAHQKGVIHRDLKPANILVDDEGQLKILDFGLAKQMTGSADPLISITGHIVGTLPYMSPEQTKGDPDLVDIRTDVYALGVVLYELLTGVYPYPVIGAVADVLNHIANTQPQPLTKSWSKTEGIQSASGKRPSTRCPINDEVETIALQALAKERERRYQSAGQLAQDIHHYLRHEPIDAKRDAGLYLLKKSLIRYRLPATVALLFVLLLATSVIALWHLRNEADRQRDTATAANDSARHALATAQDRLVSSLSFEGTALLAVGHDVEAQRALSDGLELLPHTRLSPLWITAPLLQLDDVLPANITLRGHTAEVTCAAISRDGRFALSGSHEGTLILWDLLATKSILTFHGHSLRVTCVAISRDGHTALSSSFDKTVKLWDLSSGALIRTFSGHTDRVYGVAFSPDGRSALSGGYDGDLKLWDVESGTVSRNFLSHSAPVIHVAFTPDGRTAISSSNDRLIRIWDVASATVRDSFQAHPGNAACIALSPDGQILYTGGDDSRVRAWNLETRARVRTITEHAGPVSCIAVSPNGRMLVSGSIDHSIRLFDLASGTQLRSVTGHAAELSAVAFTHDDRTILSASGDNTLKLWDLFSTHEVSTLDGHSQSVTCVAFSPDDRLALSASADHTLKLWDLATGRELRTLLGHTDRVCGVAFAPDGRSAVSASADNSLILWDLASATPIRTFRGHTGAVNSVAFTPDGHSFLSGSDDSTLLLWNTDSESPVRTFRGHTRPIVNVTISRDGNSAISGSLDYSFRRWDLASGNQLAILPETSGYALAASFLPDGHSAAIACGGHIVGLWDLTSTKPTDVFPGHIDRVVAIAVAPDGRTAISGSWDKSLKLWDLASGSEIRTFVGHTAHVNSVALSHDGNAALSASQDRTVKYWDFNRPLLRRQLEPAFQSARDALAKNPADSAALAAFGRWYAFLSIHDRAIDFLTQARTAGAPISPLLLGQCYWKLNRYPEALAQYQKALTQKQAPDFYLQLCITALQHTPATQSTSTTQPTSATQPTSDPATP